MGLGSAFDVSLAEARERAYQLRKMVKDGIDPKEEREREAMAAKVEQAKLVTFAECAKDYIEAHRAGWSNKKHAQQWTNTLTTYAFPFFGELPVAEVDTALVVRCLEPIWTTKPETASRVRGRVEAVLDYATVRTFRQGENPARWKGHLQNLLPKRSKVRKVKHHKALPYADIHPFMAALAEQEGNAARCLEFTILTAARSGESLGAQWSEVDLEARTWTIPEERMKGGRAHRVPLSPSAVELLQKMQEIRQNDFIFPGQRAGKPLSNMAMLMVLRRMKRDDLTAHGFRSTLRDWAAETTSYPNELLEMALAHTIRDKAEAAYRRGDLFEKRRQLMEDWADHVSGQYADGEVVPIRRKA